MPDATDGTYATTSYIYQQSSSGSTHIIQSIKSPSGKQPILNKYDERGRLIETVDAFGNSIFYDHDDRVSRREAVTDRNGVQAIYEYDTLGNVTRQWNASTGETTEYTYYGSGNLEHTRTTGIVSTYNQSTQQWDRDDAQAFTTTYTYDGAGNKTSESYTIDGVTFTQSWTYGTRGGRQVLLSSTNNLQVTTVNTYYSDTSDVALVDRNQLESTTTTDSTGRILSYTEYAGYSHGQATIVTSYAPSGTVGVAPTPFTRSVVTLNSQGLVTDSYQQTYAGEDGQGIPLWTTTARSHSNVDARGNVTWSRQYKPTATTYPPASGTTEADLVQNWTIALPSTSTAYDELGRVTATSTPDGLGGTLHTRTLYNADGQVYRSYDARDNYTENEYDDLGQLIATYSYDAEDNLLSSTSTTYNANGQVITSYDALNNPTDSYYDPAGRSVRTVSADGTSSETLYDAAGRAYLSIDRHLASQTTGLRGSLSLYDAAGRAIESRRLEDLSISIQETDNANHLIEVALVLPVGTTSADELPYLSRSQTFYNSLGQVWKSVDALGTATWYRYDDAGRQYQTIQAVDVDQNGTTDATDTNSDGLPDSGTEVMRTTTEYDGLGRAYRVTDANDHTTTTEYDDRGRASRTVYDDGSFVAYGYDSLGRKTWQSDQLAASSTPAQIEASKTSYQYDDRGNLIAVILPAVPDPNDGGALTNPRYVYTYDQYGNQTRQIDANAAKLLPGDLSTVTEAQYDAVPHTHFLYDNFGRQTHRILPLGQTEQTHYDDLGRIDWTRDLAGRTTVFGYDSLGRLQTKTFFSANQDPETATPDKVLTYQYNGLGQVDTITDSADGITSYLYDPEGRQTQVATPQGTIHYQYDSLGRLDRTWTSNTDVRYTYDSLSRLQSVTMVTRAGQAVAGPSLDWYGQTISGETTRYRYDPVGNLDLIQQSNGVVSDYTYDELNRLTDLAHFVDSDHDAVRDAVEATVASFHYVLNADGNKSSATEVDDQGITRTFHWTYDGLDRLTSEALDSTDVTQNQDYITTWNFDLVGNRLQQDTQHAASSAAISQFVSLGTGFTPDQTISYTYDNNDRLLTETNDLAGTANDTHTVHSWTAGDQTGKTVHAGLTDQGAVTEQTTFTYNVQGRTATITMTKDGQTTQITYKYNVGGIRVEEVTTANGTTTMKTYLIDANNSTGHAQMLEEFINGQLAKTFTLGHDVLAQYSAQTDALTLLYDGHGSTRALLDAIGVVVQRYAYHAYGTMLDGQGLTILANALTSLLYSGEMTDKLTGLQNLRDRLYDPHTGFFTQYDRYKGSVYDPRSLHRVAYTSGNPVNATDPSGRISLTEIMVATTVIGAVSGMLIGGIRDGWRGALDGLWRGALYGAAVGLVAVSGALAITYLGGATITAGIGASSASTLTVGAYGITVTGGAIGLAEALKISFFLLSVWGTAQSFDLAWNGQTTTERGIGIAGVALGFAGMGYMAYISRPTPLGYTKAYRAVGHEEYQQILRTRRFEQGPNSMEGKWFSDTPENAALHGEALEGPGNYRIIEADLPDNAPSLYKHPNIDGRGPGRYLHMDDLKDVEARPLDE